MTPGRPMRVLVADDSPHLVLLYRAVLQDAGSETAIAHEAIKLGIGVYKPYADERYDLIFDLRPQLARVQCKWASRDGDVIVARLYSNRRGPTGMIRRAYSPEDVDAFALYCPET